MTFQSNFEENIYNFIQRLENCTYSIVHVLSNNNGPQCMIKIVLDSVRNVIMWSELITLPTDWSAVHNRKYMFI